jgi:hypothetical protein
VERQIGRLPESFKQGPGATGTVWGHLETLWEQNGTCPAQGRIGRRIPWLEFLDAPGVTGGDDNNSKFLQLIELIELYIGFRSFGGGGDNKCQEIRGTVACRLP